MNHFPIDLNLVISKPLSNGQRYYDLLDFLFHLNPAELPDEAWRQLKLNEDVWDQHPVFYSTTTSVIIHKEGYPYLPLASILQLLAKMPEGIGKRISFWLNRTVEPDDHSRFIDCMAAINNLQAKFSTAQKEKPKYKSFSLILALRVSRKAMRQGLIETNLAKGLEQREATSASYYQLSRIPTLFDVVDTFGRRIRLDPSSSEQVQ